MKQPVTFIFFARKLLFLSVFALFFSACESIRPEAPEPEASEPLPEVKLSYISAPVLFPLPELRKKINETLSGTLVRIRNKSVDAGKKITVHIHDLQVKKIENIRLSAEGNLLRYTVPLRIGLDADFSKKIGIKLKMRKKISFAARFYFRSYVNFSSGRTLHTKTELDRIEWIDEPKVNFGKIEVNLRGRADKLLAAQKDKITDKIDEAALKHLSLDKPISKVWTALQKPILINKKILKIWLHSRPTALQAAVPFAKNDILYVHLQLTVRNSTLFGEKPDYEINRKLPAIRAADRLPDSCDIYLMSPVPFAEVNAVLKEKIKDLKLEFAGSEVKIKEAELSAFGPKLLVKLRTGGDIKATLYLYAKPVYDKGARNLYLDEITFDLHTEEALLGTADAFLHDTFLELLAEKVQIPLGKTLDKIPKVVDKALANSKLSKKIDLKTTGLQVIPQAVFVNKEGIAIEVRAKAHLEVVLKKF